MTFSASIVPLAQHFHILKILNFGFVLIFEVARVFDWGFDIYKVVCCESSASLGIAVYRETVRSVDPCKQPVSVLLNCLVIGLNHIHSNMRNVHEH